MPVWRYLLRILILAACLAAAYIIYRNVSRYSFEEIMASIGAIDRAHIAASIGFAACSYLCLSGFDATALRYAGKPLSYPRTLLASFTSLSIGHNVGVSALSSGAVRYRFYSRWGLSAADVAKVIVFCGVTVGLGLISLAGMAILLAPDGAMVLRDVEVPASNGMAAALVGVVILYPVAAAFLPTELQLWRWRIEVPDVRLAVAQVLIGTLNFAFVAACLHQLLLGVGDVSYVDVAKAYAIANLVAIISHVPGGLGVLEATIFLVLPEAASIGALIVFRIVYFLIPLSIGLPLFGITELLNLRHERSEHSLHEA